MALIDHANWDFEGRKVFTAEYPQKNLSSNTQLNVRQGQEAIFILGGGGGGDTKVYGPNGARAYTLDTGNLPIARKFFGIPFGGSNPVLASVWFINKADITAIPITTGRFIINDPSYAKGCPLIAHVDLTTRVTEGRVFLERLARYKHHFDEYDMVEALKGVVMTEVANKISQLVDANKLTLATLGAHYSLMADQLKGRIASLFEDFGIELVRCNILEISLDTSEEGSRIASGYGTDLATADRLQMIKLQEKALDSLSKNGGSPLGTILAMQMMGGMSANGGGSIGTAPAQGYPSHTPPDGQQNMSQQQQQQQQQQSNVKMIYCACCGNKYGNDNRFCPKCGKAYLPCSGCASDNAEDAKRCVNCGRPLQSVSGSECPNCHAAVPVGSGFCPGCGRPMSEGKCLKCGTALNGAKFCSTCGTKNN